MAKSWNLVIRTTIGERERRLINSYYGEPGMATLARCKRYLLANGDQSLDSLALTYGDRVDAELARQAGA